MPLEELLEEKSLEINSLQDANSKLLEFCFTALKLTNDQLTRLILITPQIDKLKDYLFNIVLKSKDSKELEVDAAKAISILNKAKYSFSGADLSGINISGADLSYGIFDGTIFENANLDNVNFKGSWLNNAVFKGASVKNIDSIFENDGDDENGCRKFDYLKISPNGQVVALLLQIKIILFDIKNGMLCFKKEINIRSFNFDDFNVKKIIFSHDSKKIVIDYATYSKFIDMLDLSTGIVKRLVIDNNRNLDYLMFSGNDSNLMFLNEKRKIISLDINTAKQKVFLDQDILKEFVRGMHFSPDNKNLILVFTDKIVMLDTQTNKLTKLYPQQAYDLYSCSSNPNVSVTFSFCGEFVVAAIHQQYSTNKLFSWNITNPNDSIKIFDTSKDIDIGCGSIKGLSFSPDSKYLVAIQNYWSENFLYIWKHSTQKKLVQLNFCFKANYVFWDKHNNLVIASNNNVLVWKINVNEVDDSINLQLLSALYQNKLSLHGSNFSQTKSLIADDITLLKRHGAFVEDDDSRELLFLSSSNSNINPQPEEHTDIDTLSVNHMNSCKLLQV